MEANFDLEFNFGLGIVDPRHAVSTVLSQSKTKEAIIFAQSYLSVLYRSARRYFHISKKEMWKS